MTTIGDKLTAIFDTKNKIREAITTKGGYLDEKAAFSEYPQAIYDLPVVTPSAPTNKWAPNPTWWPVKDILENHQAPEGYIAVAIFLLAATTYQTALQGWDAYRTSDGAWYPNNTIHVWDTTKDKECDEGYKTRYLIVYKKTDYSGWHGNLLMSPLSSNSIESFGFPLQIGIVINCNIFFSSASSSSSAIYFYQTLTGGSRKYFYGFNFVYRFMLTFVDTTSKGRLVFYKYLPAILPFNSYDPFLNLRYLAPLWELATVYTDVIPNDDTFSYKYLRREEASFSDSNYYKCYFPPGLSQVEIHLSPTFLLCTYSSVNLNSKNARKTFCVLGVMIAPNSSSIYRTAIPRTANIFIEPDKVPPEMEYVSDTSASYYRIENKIGLGVPNYTTESGYESYLPVGIVSFNIIDNVGSTDIWLDIENLYEFNGMSISRLTKLLSYLRDNTGNTSKTIYISATQNEQLSTTTKLQITQKNWTLSVKYSFIN